jgi:hypothetical protein
MSSNTADTLSKLKKDLAADKKKTAALSLLLVVLIVVVVRAFVSGGPDEAAAIESPKAVALKPKASDKRRPSVRPERQKVKSGKAARESSHSDWAKAPRKSRKADVIESSARAVGVDGFSRTLERNIFDTPSWARFPLDKPPLAWQDSDAEGGKPRESIWELRKAAAAQREKQHKQKEALAAEVANMVLQSTMTGPAPIAYISGRMVRVGDTIDGFSVLRIEDKAVTLEKRGFSVQLTMP